MRRIDSKEYGGVMLEDAEADAMLELERLVGAPFPKIKDNEMEYYFQDETNSSMRNGMDIGFPEA